MKGVISERNNYPITQNNSPRTNKANAIQIIHLCADRSQARGRLFSPAWGVGETGLLGVRGGDGPLAAALEHIHAHGDVGRDHAELLDGAAAHEAAVDVEGVVEEGDQQDEREVDDAVGADLCGGEAGLGEADLDGSPEGRQDAGNVHRPEGEPSEGSASVHWLPVVGG